MLFFFTHFKHESLFQSLSNLFTYMCIYKLDIQNSPPNSRCRIFEQSALEARRFLENQDDNTRIYNLRAHLQIEDEIGSRHIEI